jgi:hypothetical protein
MSPFGPPCPTVAAGPSPLLDGVDRRAPDRIDATHEGEPGRASTRRGNVGSSEADRPEVSRLRRPGSHSARPGGHLSVTLGSVGLRAKHGRRIVVGLVFLCSCTSATTLSRDIENHSTSASPSCGPRVGSVATPPSPGASATATSAQPLRGHLAFARAASPGGQLDLYVARADGSDPVRIAGSKEYEEYSPTWSADGSRLAFRVGRPHGDDQPDIWAVDRDGSNPVNLTNTPENTEWSPAWSPDGSQIAYYGGQNANGAGDIFVMRPDGSNKRNITMGKLPGSSEYPSWSPDGNDMAFIHYTLEEGNFEIWVMNADGSCPVDVTNDPAADEWPAWSPDGTKIAFASNRDGSNDIFLIDPNGANPVNLTNTADLDESFPAWTPDGSIGFVRYHGQRKAEVWVMDRDGSHAVPLPGAAGYELGPMAWTGA